MIQATEIRVGNNIIQFDAGQLLKITVTPFTFKWVYANPELFEPIPLKPEILGKCEELKKWPDSDVWEYVKDGNHFQYREGEVFLGGDESCTEGHGFTILCLYLHTLQNAFALTGTELTVNL